MSLLLIIALAALLVGAVLYAIAWRISGQDKHLRHSTRHVPYLIAATVMLAVLFGCVLWSISAHVDTRRRYEARALLAATVESEQHFRATHSTYGTLNVDLTLADPKLVKRLDRWHRLTIDLSADGKTVKITAQSGREKVSRFLGPGF